MSDNSENVYAGRTTSVHETGRSKFENTANSSGHELTGDQPIPMGDDRGPNPDDYLAMALGLCTNQTLRMYIDRKGYEVEPITTHVTYRMVPSHEVPEEMRGSGREVLCFFREIELDKSLPEDIRERMLQIANLCPVHKILSGKTPIKTSLRS